jgi:inosine/xanthosine triphosphate pyrophosphatase family protein
MANTTTQTITDEKLQELQNLTQQKLQITSIKPIQLSPTETQEIEETFQNVRDFRQLGEKITAPIDDIIEKTTQIIE